MPIAPEPTMRSLSGFSSRSMASLEEMMRLPSKGELGSGRGDAPVAMRILGAESVFLGSPPCSSNIVCKFDCESAREISFKAGLSRL